MASMEYLQDMFFILIKFFVENLVDFLRVFLWGNKRIGLLLLSLYVLTGVFLYLYEVKKKKLSPKGFFHFLFPKEIYTHPSAKMDYKSQLFLILLNPGKYLFVPISTAALSLGTLKTLNLIGRVPWEKSEPAGWPLLFVGFIGFLIQDFSEFLNHKLAHKIPFYWDIHEVHHSAEVLTPLTSKRHHPLFSIINTTLKITFLGVVQGVLVWLFFKSLGFYVLMSLNVLMLIFNAFGGNFRHSHVWVSFGWFDRLFISPAMHQIHHSVDLKHRNKNFGLWLTIWDRMFGSLYIPKEKEVLEFGIERGIESPHSNLLRFFFLPLLKIARRVKGFF